MQNIKNNRITQCLQCPVCHQVINEYYLCFYPDWKVWENAGIKESADLYEDVKKSARELSETLDIELDFEHKDITDAQERQRKINNDYITLIDELRKLGTKEKISDAIFQERPECTAIIKQILTKIITLSETGFDQEIGTDCLFILDKMKQLAFSSLPNRSEQTKTNTSSGDKKTDFQNIINNYCTNFIDYRYCNAEYAEFRNFSNLRDCRSAIFEVNVALQDRKTSLGLQSLNDSSLRIFHEYILSVPKSFGHNLSTVMRLQGVTHQDLANVFGVKKARTFQSLCEVKTTDSPQIDINKLAQALLVSKDVLYCGSGELYGVWDELIYEYSREKLKKMSYKEKMAVRTDKQNIMRILANMKSEDYIQMLNDETDFFYVRPYCVYTENDEGEYYYDYLKMVNQALHPEYIDILISVLRNNQSTE